MFFIKGELLSDLNEGIQYTEKQLIEFLTDNENIAIIGEESKHLNGISSRKHTILKKFDGYIHNASSGTYRIPVNKKHIYFID